jgi:hypothetical protein
MTEQWKDIEGYNGLYRISTMGRVKSFHKKNAKILSPVFYGDYYGVQLCINGNKKKHYIHRLVAESFIINCDNKNQINHIDGNKLNNTVSNIEWCTASENRLHAVDTGLLKVRGESNPQSKLTKEDVLEIRGMYGTGCFSQYQIADMYDVAVMQINRIVNNKAWTHI